MIHLAPQLDAGLIGCWDATAGPTGETLHNRSSYGELHSGALKNMDPATDWFVHRYGWALDFDGVDDIVHVPSLHMWAHGKRRITMACLANWGSDVGGKVAMGWRFQRECYLNGRSQPLFEIDTAGGNVMAMVGAGNAGKNDDTWRLLVGTYDADAGSNNVAVHCLGWDGLTSEFATTTGPIDQLGPVGQTQDGFGLGAAWQTLTNGSTSTWAGAIAWAGLWDRAFSEAEVVELYRRVKGRIAPRRRINGTLLGVGGPYRAAAGAAATGQEAGTDFTATAAAGETYNAGQTAGAIDGRCG